MKSIIAAAAAAVAIAATVAGCHSGGTTSAKVKAEATSTAAAAAKANLAVISGKCGTTTAAGQLAAAKDMTSKTGRAALFAKCGVPKAKRPVVEEQALAAFEKAHMVSGGHPARVTYFTVTLPKIIEANQS
jgi:hypothetical protein